MVTTYYFLWEQQFDWNKLILQNIALDKCVSKPVVWFVCK